MTDRPQRIEDIGGVSDSKADALRTAGYENIDDLRSARQDDIAAVKGIGTALAAHIKANVDDIEADGTVKPGSGMMDTESGPGSLHLTPERIYRYRGLLALVIMLLAAGAITGSEVLLIGGLIPLVFVLQGVLSTGRPIADRISIEREVRPEVPLPGQPVEVTLKIENIGDSAIADIRFLDGVPADLGVIEGSARGSGAIRPEQSISTTYTLVANRGAYEFREVTVRARNISGTVLSDAELTADGVDAFECRVSSDDVPLRQETTSFTGPLATETGGPGIEFYATREYRSGDPVKRINWRKYAKSGELSTIEFREQRAARMAVIMDSREPTHVSANESSPTGATLSAYAGTLAIGVLMDDGHHVGVGAFGLNDPIRNTSPAWVSADVQSAFASRAAAICNAAASGTGDTVLTGTKALTDGGAREWLNQRQRLLARLPADSQVLFCTPALDDEVTAIVEAFLAAGHKTTVLSPQVTPKTVGGRITALERGNRLDQLERLGATVIDWDRDEQLPLAVARTLKLEER